MYNMCVLTSNHIEITVLPLIIRMLRMLRWVFIVQCFPLDGFVFFTESDVPIDMQRCHVLGKFSHRNWSSNFTSHFAGSFPVDHTSRVGALACRRIVQIVVCGVETFSETEKENSGNLEVELEIF